MRRTPMVAPSILAADQARLAEEIQVVEKAGARVIHFDVMDGHFVPNLSFGIPVLEAVRAVTRAHLNVHLMISNADEMALRYAEAGADTVLMHYEVTRHLDQLLRSLRDRDCGAGVVLNPHTPVSVLEEILPLCDDILIMSVNPGFGGQEFISTSLEKVRKLRTLIQTNHLDVRIEIDGGIGLGNVRQAVEAGVDLVVAGTSIFGTDDPAAAFKQMQSIAESAAAESANYV